MMETAAEESRAYYEEVAKLDRRRRDRANVEKLLYHGIECPSVGDRINTNDDLVRSVIFSDPHLFSYYRELLSGDAVGDYMRFTGIPESCIKVPK